MKLSQLSTEAGEGLIKWAIWQHDDELLFDCMDNLQEQWAWILLQLKVADDQPDWFPKGKWATLQIIEQMLMDEARQQKRAA